MALLDSTARHPNMLRTIADAIIAIFLVIIVATGIAGLLFKRVGQRIFTVALGGLYRKITEPARQAEQQQKIELIVQEARAKQATAYEEQKLLEDAERRARIRRAHDQLTKSYTILATYAAASPGSYSVDAVAEARQAAAQLRVECPELSDPLTQISRSLQSPQNLGSGRAHDLLAQVTEGVEKALRR